MRIAILGPLVVEDGTAAREVAGGRLQALLARLAIDAGRAVSPGALAAAVWDGDPPRDEQHALQSLVSRLRRALGDAGLIAQEPGGYRLAVAPEEVDAVVFERLAREGGAALRAGDAAGAARRLDAALALWRGAPAADAPRLAELHAAARLDRLAAAEAQGEVAAHLAELAELAAERPLDERLGALRLRALAAAGRQAEALATYEELRRVLDEELGATPSAELQAAHLAVLRGEAAAPPAPARPAPPTRGNLPAARTSFVGRDADLERAGELLTRHRLVTLVGPGGAGKTRLALELAARQDGPAWLAELAPLGDGDALAPALLGALGLRAATLPDRRAAAADAESQLVDALAAGEPLLVLDNCEHLVVPAARLADRLLAACRGLRIVATSREPLGIGGEALAAVGPLDEPAAVALFADRAASVAPGFALDAETEPVVADVCRRIDGLPLAIELAAARLRSMPLEQLAERLHDRFRLLTGGSRAAAGRQRTLRAVVDWSWDLLGEPERRVLRRLSVFSGGTALDAAESVCAGDGVDADDVFELLTALVDRSLLQVAGSAPRWRMLETIREYAEEEAERAGELRGLREAHARHFAAFAAEADRRLRGADQVRWLERLRADHDNLLSAVRFLAETGEGALALRTALNLLWFWALTDGRDEAVTWLRTVLATDAEHDPRDQMLASAIVAWTDHALPPAEGAVDPEAALELLAGADLSDRPLLAVAAPVVAFFSHHEELAAELLAGLDEHPDPWVHAMAEFIRAHVAENAGDLETMAVHLDESLARFRAIGDRWGMAVALSERASLRMLAGDLDGAEAALDGTEALLAELGSRVDGGMILLRRSDLRVRQGDLPGARALLEDAYERARDRDERLLVRVALAAVTWRLGDREAGRALRDEAVEAVERLDATRPDYAHLRAVALGTAAALFADEGALEHALELAGDAYAAAVRSRDRPILGRFGECAAWIAVRSGDAAGAAEILGAAMRIGGSEDPANPYTLELRDELRDALGEERLTTAIAAGRELGPEEAAARLDPAKIASRR